MKKKKRILLFVFSNIFFYLINREVKAGSKHLCMERMPSEKTQQESGFKVILKRVTLARVILHVQKNHRVLMKTV